jgi:hypothetical protein
MLDHPGQQNVMLTINYLVVAKVRERMGSE